MRQSLNAPDEEMLEHPDGCMCDECKIERGEMPPKKKPGRPRQASPQNAQPQDRSRFLTPPVEPPQSPHALYEYERGELRRCHLCGAGGVNQHLNFSADEVWFATLEDRARHILECHTDEADPIVKRERQRSKEILGIAEIWNSHSHGKQVNFKKGLREEYTAPVQPMMQQPSNPISSLFGKKQPKAPQQAGQGNWFSRNKLFTAVIVIVALYGLYYLYLISQGYE
jgi:hypothetical protein